MALSGGLHVCCGSCCCHIVLSLTTNFIFFKATRQALWPTQLPTQLVMTLISHLHVVLKLRMCGAIPPLLYMPSWCAAFAFPYSA
jgi:hypothetical protein